MEIYYDNENGEKCTDCIYLRWPIYGPITGFSHCLLHNKNAVHMRKCKNFCALTIDFKFNVEDQDISIMTYINYLESCKLNLQQQLDNRIDKIKGLRRDLTETQKELFELNKETKMDGKISGIVSKWEEQNQELKNEISRQNAIIKETLLLVQKISVANESMGQNLLTVTKDFNKFKSTIIKAIVWLSIGFSLSLLARALQLFN